MTNRRLVALLGACGGLTSTILLAQRGDAFNALLRTPDEQRALFHLPPGFEIQLVAAEPEIQKPFNLAFDAAGRVWVTGSTLYPWPARRDALGQPIASFEKNWDENQLAFRAMSTPPEPAEHGADTVRILSDFDPATGRARKVTVFADGLNIPIGILPLPALSSSHGPRASNAKGDTALVFSIPAIWRLTDTDGDGRADVREKLYDGFGFKDTHGMSSSYWLWFDGWVYGTHGFSNKSEIVDRAGRTLTIQSGNTYRFRPDGSRIEVFAHGQTNPFGLAFDARGDVYTADSHSKPVYLLVPGGYYEGLSREHDGLGFAPSITTDDHGSTAIAGIAHYSAAQFPAEYHGNLFNGNPVTRRINRARLDWRGSSPTAVRQSDFLTSDDPSFRPVQVKLGPDGALWIADFYNPIIGHYEVPLTHPGRDRSHGRIWRIVWRGLDRDIPVPTMPNLARESGADLVARLSDPNLVVRSIAASEIVARETRVTIASALSAAAARLISGHVSAVDETAALPILFTLDQIDAADDTLLRRALQRPESDVAVAALRVFAARDALPADAEELFTTFFKHALSEHAARVAAEMFQRHPQRWQPALILALLAKASSADFELTYALRLALKTHALTADAETLCTWTNENPAAAERVADVCLAVPTPAAADFLLTHLVRTKFSGSRTGDFARHAVVQLPANRLAALQPLLHALKTAPLAQRIAFAEGLASVAAKPGRPLPDDIDAWMRRELFGALAEKDWPLVTRAINALNPLPVVAKAAVLRRVIVAPATRDLVRIAALRALTPNAPETEEVLITALAGNGTNALRRTAAELLGNSPSTPAARVALARAFTTASADVALTLATALAKSDAGAADLIDLAAAGRVPRSLLRHRHVALALEKRPAELRARAAELTRGLPPEDARIDALIAQRLAAAANLKPLASRGAAVFSTHCATCHRFRETGGNLGPTLDGLTARTVARLVEDILDPSRNVDPAFRLTTVTLKNGETKSGMSHRDESDRVMLTDPANGQPIIIGKRDVAEVSASPVSPMPAAFDTLLSEQELVDLIAFLRGTNDRGPGQPPAKAAKKAGSRKS